MKAGWEVKSLGEIFEIGSSKRVIKSEWTESGVPFYRAREIVKLAKNGFVDNDLFIAEEHFEALVSKHGGPVAGDLMVSAVGTLGICYEVKAADRFYYKDASVLCLHPKAPINSRFVEYAFQTQEILDQVTAGEGATVGTFTIGRAKATLINLPPLEEQKRIVAVLDAAFEGLTRAKENAEANLQNARELFGAFLEELFLKNGKNWSAAALQNTVTEDCTLSYGIVQPGDDVENGLPIVRPTDLRKPLISKGGLKTIAPEKAEGYMRTRLLGDEILLCVRGTTGVVAKALPELEGGNVTRGIVPIRFDSQKMLQDFGYYQFRSRHIQEQIEAQTYGAALRQINIRDLRKLNFVFPEIKEQERLLPMLQDAQRSCEDLVEVNLAKLTDISDLRQSLLQKAFAGELT